SGTAVLLEIAERFVTEKPARSIIFVSHTGEEGGLLGSRWFTDHPTIPLISIAAALNMDIVDSVNATRSETMAIDRTWDVSANPMNRFCRSDQVNYVKHDVPVTYISLGYAEDYHQPTDEPQYIEYE